MFQIFLTGVLQVHILTIITNTKNFTKKKTPTGVLENAAPQAPIVPRAGQVLGVGLRVQGLVEDRHHHGEPARQEGVEDQVEDTDAAWGGIRISCRYFLSPLYLSLNDENILFLFFSMQIIIKFIELKMGKYKEKSCMKLQTKVKMI